MQDNDHSIIFINSLQSPNLPKYPYEFNYAQYLANQQVYHTGFINDYDFFLLPRESTFLEQLSRVRNKIVEIIYTNISDPASANLIAAMLLGYKDAMDAEIIKDFQQAGVVHLLALSGLHVGIIYGGIYLLLSFIIPFKYRNKITIPLALITLWLYTLMVGAMPSVVRAAIMLTLLQIGVLFNRPVNNYNSLATAALFILIANPLQLYSLGFQLSFTAVLGIFFFNAPLMNICKTNKKWLKWVIGSLSVTMAAQLGTLPLTIYYFHQFPTYFLIANLIAVPMASILIYIGFFAIILSFIPFVGLLIKKIFALLVKLFILFIRFISDLPYSTLSNIYIDPLSAFLIGIIIILIVLQIYYKNIKIYPSLIITVILFGINYNLSIAKRIRENPSFEILNNKYAVIGQKEQEKFHYLIIKPDSAQLPDINTKIDMFCNYYYCKNNNSYDLQDKVKSSAFYLNNPVIANKDQTFVVGDKKEILHWKELTKLPYIEIGWYRLRYYDIIDE
ncbi:MAG: ComEC/Rec2 family competence protein [Bacteroidales bacterium]